MKRFSFVTLLVVSALFLSSCSMHLGLSSMLNPGSATAKPADKKIKATHTPPAPGSSADGNRFRMRHMTALCIQRNR